MHLVKGKLEFIYIIWKLFRTKDTVFVNIFLNRRKQWYYVYMDDEKLSMKNLCQQHEQPRQMLHRHDTFRVFQQDTLVFNLLLQTEKTTDPVGLGKNW